MKTLPRRLALGAALLTTTALLTGGAAAQAAPAPGPAAGTVEVWNGTWLIYTAGAGVANNVVVTGTLDPILALQDDAPVVLGASAGTYCVQASTTLIRCKGLTRAVVSLGDGDDLMYVAGYPTVTVVGGSGKDQLGASENAKVALHGGADVDRCAAPVQARSGCEQSGPLNARPQRP